jgi:hypothetical protein
MRISTIEGKLFEAVDDQKLNAASGKNGYWRLKRLLVRLLKVVLRHLDSRLTDLSLPRQGCCTIGE